MSYNKTLLIGLLFLGACHSDSRKSIVGGWQVADDRELSRDTVTLSFRKENGTDFPATLSYSLQPGGLLTIEKGRDHAVCCFGGIDRHLVDRRWQIHLPNDQQIAVKRMLAKLRPRTLSKDFPFELPNGCSFVYDSGPWASVAYVRRNVGGLFVFQSDCTGAGAEGAMRVLHSVVAMLPATDRSADFVDQLPGH